MKTLVLVRHAQPEKTGPDGTDRTRRLTPEGVQEATAQGAVLRNARIRLDRVDASDADRARETAELLTDGAGLRERLHLTGALYGAPGAALLDYVQGLPDEAAGVMLVGHMPGMGELLSLLVTSQGDLAVKIAPGTMACLSLEAEQWREVGPGSGVLLWMLPPMPPEA